MLAEGEGAAATSLRILKRLVGAKYGEIIHRVPSVEGATATSLGNFSVIYKYIKINRKKRSKWCIPSFLRKNRRKVTMERTSYSTYSVGKGKEYPFEFKLDAVFAAQELGIKPASRKFKISVNTTRSWLRRFKKKVKKDCKINEQVRDLFQIKSLLMKRKKL
jgi:transposase-like protein